MPTVEGQLGGWDYLLSEEGSEEGYTVRETLRWTLKRSTAVMLGEGIGRVS